ncbi:MAG: SH3 domain-containing protein, partial [Bacteroidota bacterium]
LDPPTAPAPAPKKEAPAEPQPLTADDELVTWVDRINVRASATTDAKVVARIPNGETMVYLGEQSPRTETILLRSKAYREPWLKVKTKNGQQGWVFGGAVKRPGEDKGNQVITATKLDYPYFGRYDLSDWKELPASVESGGDAEINQKRYQNGAQIMTVIETDLGEYGYTYIWRLADVEDRVLLERKLTFQADLDWLLTEIVTNRIESPDVEYSRSEELSVHPMQLGGRPLLVNGPWTKKEL